MSWFVSGLLSGVNKINYANDTSEAVAVWSITAICWVATVIICQKCCGDSRPVRQVAPLSSHSWQYEGFSRSECNNFNDMLEKVNNNGDNLQFASLELKKNKELVEAAVRAAQGKTTTVQVKEEDSSYELPRVSLSPFRFADPSLKEDKEFVLQMVAIDSRVLIFASQELQQDPDIIQCAIEKGIKSELMNIILYELDYIDASHNPYEEFRQAARRCLENIEKR